MKRELGDMDMQLYKKIINQLKGYTNKLALHHFGESLLYKNIDEMIKYANKKEIKTVLSVNASVLVPALAKKIIDAGIYQIYISLDSTDDKMYKKIRGSSADYSKALKNIEEILNYKKDKKKNTKISVGMINMKMTKKEIQKFKNQWEKKGIEVIIKEFTTWEGSSKEIIELAEKSQFSEAFKKRKDLPCLRPWHRMTILWDGRVVPCCYDYDGKCILGDLKKQSLKEIWNSKKIKELRRQHIENDFRGNSLCANCKEKNGLSLKHVFTTHFLERIKTYLRNES
jgi:radical SAM protein with 4Fe4S-binding SPASM domain